MTTPEQQHLDREVLPAAATAGDAAWANYPWRVAMQKLEAYLRAVCKGRSTQDLVLWNPAAFRYDEATLHTVPALPCACACACVAAANQKLCCTLRDALRGPAPFTPLDSRTLHAALDLILPDATTRLPCVIPKSPVDPAGSGPSSWFVWYPPDGQWYSAWRFMSGTGAAQRERGTATRTVEDLLPARAAEDDFRHVDDLARMLVSLRPPKAEVTDADRGRERGVLRDAIRPILDRFLESARECRERRHRMRRRRHRRRVEKRRGGGAASSSSSSPGSSCSDTSPWKKDPS